MRIETIKIFLSIVETGSVSRSARMHHLTQPAVTSQIHALEEELGGSLLERLPRQRSRITPTKKGEVFLPFARKILDTYEESKEAMENPKGQQGSITVGTSPTNGTYVFPYLVESFKRKFPGIIVRTFMSTGNSIHRDLLEGMCNIAITTNNSLETGQIVYEKLDSDPLVLVAGSDYAVKRIITVEQLKALPLILRNSGTTSRRIIENGLLKESCSMEDLNVVLQVFDNESVKQSVSAGLGVGFVTESSMAGMKGVLKKIRVKNLRFERSLYLMRKEGSELSPSMRSFWRYALSKKWIPLPGN